MLLLTPAQANGGALYPAKLWWRGLAPLLLLMAVGVSACNSSAALSFPDLCLLPKEQFGNMNAQQVALWIKDKYGVNPDWKERTEDRSKIVLYTWTSGHTLLDAELRNGTLFRFSQSEMERGPRLGQVVAGLGTPEAVSSTGRVFEGVQYTLFLDYPTHGVSVGVVRMVRNEETRNDNGMEIRLSPDMEVTHIKCYVPQNSLRDLLHTVYEIPLEEVSNEERRLAPWPGFGAWMPIH